MRRAPGLRDASAQGCWGEGALEGHRAIRLGSPVGRMRLVARTVRLGAPPAQTLSALPPLLRPGSLRPAGPAAGVRNVTGASPSSPPPAGRAGAKPVFPDLAVCHLSRLGCLSGPGKLARHVWPGPPGVSCPLRRRVSAWKLALGRHRHVLSVPPPSRMRVGGFGERKGISGPAMAG